MWVGGWESESPTPAPETSIANSKHPARLNRAAPPGGQRTMRLEWASLLLLLCASCLSLTADSPTTAPAQDKTRQPQTAAAAAQSSQPQGEEKQELDRLNLLARQRRSSGLVQNIDQLYSGGGKVGYFVYVGGRRFLLDLERDDSVGTAGGILTAGGGLSASSSHRGHCFYRGTVDGSPRSLAVFDLCGGLDGFFAVKHARYTLKPLLRSWAEAEARRVYGDGSSRVLHIYTREGFSFEALPPRASCETPASPLRPQERPSVHSSSRRRTALAPQLPDQSTFSPAEDAVPQTWWRRRRRSISRARQVELLLVADSSMARMYGRGLQHYLLTLASIANRLYSHASIENHIRLAVVKVVVLADKDKSLEVSKNAATTLKNFCKWQHQHNQLGDDHEEHYDAAILFTREVGAAGGCPALGCGGAGGRDGLTGGSVSATNYRPLTVDSLNCICRKLSLQHLSGVQLASVIHPAFSEETCFRRTTFNNAGCHPLRHNSMVYTHDKKTCLCLRKVNS